MYSHCYVHSVARCTAWQLAVAMCRGARTGPSQRARRPVDVSLSSVKGRQGNKRSGQRPICAVLHAHMQPVMAACHYTRAITKRIASVVGQSAWRSAHGQRQAGSALAAASSGAAVAITGCSTATAATGVLSASALSAWRSHVPVVPGEVHVLWMQLGTQRGPEDKDMHGLAAQMPQLCRLLPHAEQQELTAQSLAAGGSVMADGSEPNQAALHSLPAVEAACRVASRALVRAALSRALTPVPVQPQDLTFTRNIHGKPQLNLPTTQHGGSVAGTGRDSGKPWGIYQQQQQHWDTTPPTCLPLQHNLSHTSDLAGVAFCVGHAANAPSQDMQCATLSRSVHVSRAPSLQQAAPSSPAPLPCMAVGLDVERLDRVPRVPVMALARRRLAAQEVGWLAGLPCPESAREGLMVLWAAKEALVKARGAGISAPPGLKAFAIGLERLPGSQDSGSDASSAPSHRPGLQWRVRVHTLDPRLAHCAYYMLLMRPTPAHVAALCLVRPSLTWQQRQAARAACGVEAETWDPALPCMAPLHQPQDLGMHAGDASSDACLPVPVAGSSANDGCPACTGPMRLHQSLVWPHAWEQPLGTTHMHPAALPPALQANEAADSPAQHAQPSHMHDADAPPPGCSALLGRAAGWGSIIGSTCGWEEPQQELACNLL